MKPYLSIFLDDDGVHFRTNTDNCRTIWLKSKKLNKRALTVNSKQYSGLIICPHTDNVEPIDINEVLNQFVNVKGVKITEKCFNVDSLFSFNDLQKLKLSSIKEIDGNKVQELVNLRELLIDGNDFLGRLEVPLPQVEVLSVWHVHEGLSDLNFLSKFPNLKQLRIVYSDITSLEGLKHTPLLVSLNLQALSDLSCISGLSYVGKTLLELNFDSCRQVNSDKGIDRLSSLRKLRFQNWNPLKDFKFSKNLKDLRFLSFDDVDVLDGKISRLLDLPNLRRVFYTSKKNFDLKLPKFEKILQERFKEVG